MRYCLIWRMSSLLQRMNLNTTRLRTSPFRTEVPMCLHKNYHRIRQEAVQQSDAQLGHPTQTHKFLPIRFHESTEDHNGKHDTRHQKVQCNTDATVYILIWKGQNVYNIPEVWQAHYRTHCQFLPVSCNLPNTEHNRCDYLMMLSNVKSIQHLWHINEQVWNTSGMIIICDNRVS